MNNATRLVLFDLDGTLVDTAPDFHACLNQLRQEHQLATLSYESVRAEVSNGGSALIRLAFQIERDAPEFPALLERLLQLYSLHIADHSRLFSGMEQVLTWLEAQQWPWGVVTNKPERFSRPLLQQLNLLERCSALICPEQVQHTKPDPEGILTACRQLNHPPERCIYIGDHQRDIEAGKNAGSLTASALFGYIEADQNPQSWQADFNASSPSELLTWLQKQPLKPTGTQHV